MGKTAAELSDEIDAIFRRLDEIGNELLAEDEAHEEIREELMDFKDSYDYYLSSVDYHATVLASRGHNCIQLDSRGRIKRTWSDPNNTDTFEGF